MVVRAASSRRARRARLFAMRLFAVCLLVHVSSRAARARGVEEDAKTHRTDADADADASVPPLTRAVSDGNLPEVIALLKSLPESCDARTAYGETALHVASIEPRGEVSAAAADARDADVCRRSYARRTVFEDDGVALDGARRD